MQKGLNRFLIATAIFAILIFPQIAMADETEVVMVWEKTVGTGTINSVDLKDDATMVFYGNSTGYAGAYRSNGEPAWDTALNGSVTKVKVSPGSDYLVAMTEKNESVLMNSLTGAIVGYLKGSPQTDGWIKDVDIASDGRYYFTLFDKSMYIRYLNTYYASNKSNYGAGTGGVFASSPWLNATYSSSGAWVLAGKVANSTLQKLSVIERPYYNDNNVERGALTNAEVFESWFPHRTQFNVTNSGSVSLHIGVNESITSPSIQHEDFNTMYIIPKIQTNLTDPISGVLVAYKNNTQVSTYKNTYYNGYAINVGTNQSTKTFVVTKPPGTERLRQSGTCIYNATRGVIYQYGGSNKSTIKTATGFRKMTVINLSASPIVSDGDNRGTFMFYNGSMWLYGSTSSTSYVLYKSNYLSSDQDPHVFTPVNTSMPHTTRNNYAGLAAKPDSMYLFGYYIRGVAKSTDMGKTWHLINKTYPSSTAYIYTIQGTEGNLWNDTIWLYGSGVSGLQRLNTATGIWERINTTFPASATRMGSMTVFNSELYYYNPVDAYLYNLTWQSGKNWVWKNTGIKFPQTTQYSTQMCADDTSIYLGNSDSYSTPTIQTAYRATDQVYSANHWVNRTTIYNLSFTKPTGYLKDFQFYFGNLTSGRIWQKSSITAPVKQVQGNYSETETAPVKTPYLISNATAALTGTFQRIDSPEAGGSATVSTSNRVMGYVITNTGLTNAFSTASSAGNSADIETADSMSELVDARNLEADIYNNVGTLTGSYGAGGVLRSVDISDQTGEYIIAGGDGGKTYIFAYTTGAWEIIYSGAASNPLKAAAITITGDYAVAGGSSGRLEFYYVLSPVRTDLSSTSTNWYTPHQVQFNILDVYGNSINEANVSATAIAATIPDEWLRSVYGINATAANQMVNNTFIMSGLSGSDGGVTFTMHGSIRYFVNVTLPAGTEFSTTVMPLNTEYDIRTGTLFITNATSTSLSATVNTTLTFEEPTINTIRLGLVYWDPSGDTQQVEFYVKAVNNNSIMYYENLGNPGTNVRYANWTTSNTRGMQYIWNYSAVRLT